MMSTLTRILGKLVMERRATIIEFFGEDNRDANTGYLLAIRDIEEATSGYISKYVKDVLSFARVRTKPPE